MLTRLRIARAVILFIVAAITLVSVVLANQSPAGAATVMPPTAPPPINGLPSTVIGSTPTGGSYSRLEYQMSMLYQWSKKPSFWQAVNDVQAGKGTPAQQHVLTTEAQTRKTPATKIGGLTKVGGALGVITNFSMGAQIGNGLVTMAGYDVNGLVCQQAGAEFLAILTAADCSAPQFAPGYQANSDVTAGTIISGACTTSGSYDINGSALATKYSVSCGGKQAFIRQSNVQYNEHVFTPAGVLRLLSVSRSGNTFTFNWEMWANGMVTYPERANWANSTGAEMRCITNGRYTDGSNGQQQMITLSTATAAGAVQSTRQVSITCPGGGVGAFVSGWKTCPTGPQTSLNACSNLGYAYGQVYRDGQPLNPVVGSSADPARTLRCVVLGTNGQTYSASTDPYYESQGALPVPKCADLPAGVDIQKLELWIDTVGGNPAPQKIHEETATPEYTAGQQLAPECSSGTCLLDLRSSVGSCFQSPSSCADWMSDPNRDSTYSCHYGTHAVALSECFVYGPTFKPDAQTTGNVYGDPETGQPAQAPQGAPTGSDTQLFGTPTQNPATGRQCFPTGWAALNPVEWVFRPVQCALEWAFVPRQSALQQSYTTTNQAWAGTPPSKLANVVTAWSLQPVPGGCSGVTAHLAFLPPPIGEHDVTFFAACPGDLLAPYAVWVKLFLTVSIVIAGALAITRSVGGVVSFPGVAS